MSVNILVETRVAPRETFEIENPIIFAGEIAINEEGSGVKIGDGKKRWADLDYIILNQIMYLRLIGLLILYLQRLFYMQHLLFLIRYQHQRILQ